MICRGVRRVINNVYAIQTNASELFIERLKKVAKDNKLMMFQLLEQVEIPHSTAGRWRIAKALPNIEHTFYICDDFNVSADWLFGLSNEPELTRNYSGENKEYAEIVAERLLTITADKGINDVRWKELTGLHKDGLWRYTRGVCKPSMRNLFVIAVALNCSINYLIGLSDGKEIKNRNEDIFRLVNNR